MKTTLMTKEKAILIISLIFGIVGSLFFLLYQGLFSLLNFLLGFFIVNINFMFLEKFTAKIVSKNPGKAGVLILLGLLRYPLIGFCIFVIIKWKNFNLIPFVVGMSAIVAGLFSLLFTGGEEQNGA